MKIIIAPSKNKILSSNNLINPTKPLFKDKTDFLLNLLLSFSKSDLGKIMKIKNKMLDQVYSNIQNFNKNKEGIAISSFNGLVFKGLNIDSYSIDELKYINKHLLILDAFYGIIEPSTLIKDYRLDFLIKLGINLYDFWDIDKYFNDELVINLASKEFSKMLKTTKYISISFLQQKDGKYKNQATYSKQARGILLDYMICNQVTTLNEIKKFDKLSYKFNIKLSDNNSIIFTR